MSTKLKKVFGIMLIFVLSVAVIGCGDKTVATVNGEKITQKQLEEELDFKSKQIGIDLKDPKFEGMVEALKSQTLEEVIQKILILQEGKNRKIEVTDAEVQENVDTIVKEFFDGDNKAFEDYLKSQNITVKFIKQEIKLDMIENKIVEQILADATITDANIKKFYDENKDSFGKQVEASHILVETEKEAKDIIEQLKAVEAEKFTEEFAKLAKEKSTDNSKEDGGKLGFFGKGKMVPEFENSAFALKVGEFTLAPVKSEFGYHIIYVTATKETQEDFKEDVKRFLENEALDKFFTGLQEKAKVEYKPGYEPKPQMPSGMGGMPPGMGGTNPHETGEIPLDDTGKENKK